MKLRLSLCLVLGLFLASGQLLSRSLRIISFKSDLKVSKDGQLVVTETIQPHFTGAWNGLFRLIPVRYRTPQNPDFRLDLQLISITDEKGNPFRYEESRSGHSKRFKIWIPGAVDTTRTIQLSYLVRNGLQFFEEYDELYWNVTGDEWEVPIQQASATVHLPEELTGTRAVAFTGAYGSKEQGAAITVSPSRVTFETRQELNLHEGLTIAVAWDSGVVARPSRLEETSRKVASFWPFLWPIIVLMLMYQLWKRRGQDPRQGPLIVRYKPPEGFTAAETGTLIDNRPDTCDLTAILVDLAVRGYIRIDEVKEERFLGLWTETSYEFHSLKQPSQWADLYPYESRLLRSFFDSGTEKSVKLSKLKNHFYREVPKIQDELFERLVQLKCYRKRPDKVKHFYFLLAGALAGATVAASLLFVEDSPITFLQILAAGFLAAIIVGIFGAIMPARTQSGSVYLTHILGFEEFLSRVDGERLKRVIDGPEAFEAFLPYAMALRVEEQWAKAFEDIYREPPNWYHGTATSPGTFRTGILVSQLSQMASDAGTAMLSSPRSSGGSSFSGGGGFSGGGFGGGGGGGF